MQNHRQRLAAISFLFFLFFPSRDSPALDGCYYYVHAGSDANTCADPSGRSVTGASFPSFSDSFNANPASIPTIPTPYGIELVGKTLSNPFAENSQTNFALIKGFRNVGAAASTNSDRTFFSTGLGNAISGTDYEAAYNEYINSMNPKSSFNVGSAISLAVEKIKKVSIPSLGIGLRYNRVSNRFDYQPGLSINTQFIHLGYSVILHTASQEMGIESYQTKTFNLGFRYGIASFDLTRIKPESALYHEMTDLYSLSLQIKGLHLTAAHRRFKNILQNDVSMNLFALQAKLTSFLSAGYLLNYIPGSHSFVLQILL